MIIVIVLSCAIYVLSTDPGVKYQPSDCDSPVCDNEPECPGRIVCEPEPPKYFFTIEIVCIAFFTADYTLRMLFVGLMPPRLAGVLPNDWDEVASDTFRQQKVIVPDPEFSPWWILLKYFIQPMNIVDLVAIVPFFIEYATSSGSSIAIVRVLRLARMLRIFKASKYNEGTKLLATTLTRSFSALSLLFFFTALGVVLFGSLIYFVESGNYTVTEDYPDGVYLRKNLRGDEMEISPFTSIIVSCYWVIVTATTVGFGDLYPTSSGGRLVACVCMYCGLLVLALPITVVGSNFSRVYSEKEEREEYEKEMEELFEGVAATQSKKSGPLLGPFGGALRVRTVSSNPPVVDALGDSTHDPAPTVPIRDEMEIPPPTNKRDILKNIQRDKSEKKGVVTDPGDVEMDKFNCRPRASSNPECNWRLRCASSGAVPLPPGKRIIPIITPAPITKKYIFKRQIIKIGRIMKGEKLLRNRKVAARVNNSPYRSPGQYVGSPADSTSALSILADGSLDSLNSLVHISEQLNCLIDMLKESHRLKQDTATDASTRCPNDHLSSKSTSTSSDDAIHQTGSTTPSYCADSEVFQKHLLKYSNLSKSESKSEYDDYDS
eukprot:CAMPEP_0185031892 /NCGR_PEP_ID=MMETSP1103-20130426/19603_1 /TAXON_ID=36769 /ORGANISM="Paraphysomonas bandaiensis, Strain Caron Lab Isolate" /LENGTH=603 /DNA_ID=CAMNT_0027567571 /DNA_START=334 /DNA_END=2145 /DNA_ORIENTATION=-